METRRKLVFFKAGELVQLKQDIPNKPTMVVRKVAKSRTTKPQERSVLLGVVCYWFSNEGIYQQQTFDSKDLTKVQDA